MMETFEILQFAHAPPNGENQSKKNQRERERERERARERERERERQTQREIRRGNFEKKRGGGGCGD